jgi:AcrR family transcriptional regulator
MADPTTLDPQLTSTGEHASIDARAPRAPQQERGQRRVDQILDAAEAVFAEQSVGAVSMQAIADRAGASVGSLYHFFPNKDAVVEALGRRYADRMRETNEEAMPLSLVHSEPNELFDRVLSFQMRFIERTPAFGQVHEAVMRNCPEISNEMNAAITGHVGTFLALRYPRLPEAQRMASAMVSVAMVHTILHLATQMPPAVRDEVIAEGKRMLVSHYSAYDAMR